MSGDKIRASCSCILRNLLSSMGATPASMYLRSSGVVPPKMPYSSFSRAQLRHLVRIGQAAQIDFANATLRGLLAKNKSGSTLIHAAF